MTESGISRIGAATGVVSVVVTFVGFGVHGAYMLDSAAFTLSFEIAALFLLALGILLWTRPIALRLIGASGVFVGLVLFVTGLLSTASIQSSSSQIGYMVFSLWTVIAGIYLLIRPAPITRAA